MLQAVIADDYVAFGMRGAQGTRGIDPICPDPDRYAGGAVQQQRLIAHLLRTAVRRDFNFTPFPISLRSVTSCDDTGLKTRLL